VKTIAKPGADEYPSYAIQYIGLLPDDGLLLRHFADNLEATGRLIRSLRPDRLLHRYADGKWTIKEILGHVIDDERIYVYRALRFARNDPTEIPGFDPDHYARYAGSNSRTAEDLLQELTAVRASTIAFFQSLEDDAWTRSGVANGNKVSVRALAYHIAGHELRHVNIIKERYLS
jgi:uncharacterized damage-inducible protein DinB